MTTHDKARKMVFALGQLHDELDVGTSNANTQRKAIRDYMRSAGNESMALFYDIINPTPRPLGADEVICSVTID